MKLVVTYRMEICLMWNPFSLLVLSVFLCSMRGDEIICKCVILWDCVISVSFLTIFVWNAMLWTLLVYG